MRRRARIRYGETGVFVIRDLATRAVHSYQPVSMADAVMSVVPKRSTLVDLGCGQGMLLRLLRKRGRRRLFGVDGTEGMTKKTGGLVREFDLVGNVQRLKRSVGWALFLNVGEHVPRRFEQRLIDNVSSIPVHGLIVAWADDQTPDRHPKNKRECYWVAAEFGRRKWRISPRATRRFRKIVGPYSRLDQRSLVFVR